MALERHVSFNLQVIQILLLFAQSCSAKEQAVRLGEPLTPDDFENAASSKFVVPGSEIITDRFGEDDVIRGFGEQSDASTKEPVKFQIWEGGRIPYAIDLFFDAAQRAEIGRAMLTLMNSTCIKFYPKTYEADYILFRRIIGEKGLCGTYIGRASGEQPLYLSSQCMKEGHILHELMHVVGFEHEQCREDRDDFIRIAFSNISPKDRHNFLKIQPPRANYAGPYDLGSITHYSSTAFGKKPGLQTIFAKDPSKDSLMGQREGLSQLDLLKIRNFYNCSNTYSRGKDGPIGNGQSREPCEQDAHLKCLEWAERGECSNYINGEYMQIYCKNSCRIC